VLTDKVTYCSMYIKFVVRGINTETLNSASAFYGLIQMQVRSLNLVIWHCSKDIVYLGLGPMLALLRLLTPRFAAACQGENVV
jgi:hypothetical protein